ncbi:MAG: DUF4214 domain-containing protein [Alphaproteobacteria bacterium]|nr:DUF4214 domain-containing protein [Alphaproteobacteria bacterium]
MIYAPQSEQITQIYIGYFNRAPDPEGLNYWVGRLQSGVSPVAIADSFARQTEAISAYSYLANPAGAAAEAFLNSVYTNLFNRAPDAAGLAYWKGELSAGKPLGRTIIDFISCAQGADKSLVDHNVALAESYVGGLTGVNGGGFSLGAPRRAAADAGATVNATVQTADALHRPSMGNGFSITFLDSSGTLAPY